MSVIRKIARPCGIAGGIWGLLAPALILVPLGEVGGTPPLDKEVVERKMASMLQAGVAGDALPVLCFIALIGLLGLVAIVLHKRKPKLGRIFIWASASAMLVVSLLSLFSIGLFFLPTSILLVLAAIGMGRIETTSV